MMEPRPRCCGPWTVDRWTSKLLCCLSTAGGGDLAGAGAGEVGAGAAGAARCAIEMGPVGTVRIFQMKETAEFVFSNCPSMKSFGNLKRFLSFVG
jgi:hypothetical protein